MDSSSILYQPDVSKIGRAHKTFTYLKDCVFVSHRNFKKERSFVKFMEKNRGGMPGGAENFASKMGVDLSV